MDSSAPIDPRRQGPGTPAFDDAGRGEEADTTVEQWPPGAAGDGEGEDDEYEPV